MEFGERGGGCLSMKRATTLKLDGVGTVDNRPFIDKLQHFKKIGCNDVLKVGRKRITDSLKQLMN